VIVFSGFCSPEDFRLFGSVRRRELLFFRDGFPPPPFSPEQFEQFDSLPRESLFQRLRLSSFYF